MAPLAWLIKEDRKNLDSLRRRSTFSLHEE